MHEAPPASDGHLGRKLKLGPQGIVSLLFFIAALVFFLGLMTGFIDGEVVFKPLVDIISFVGSLLGSL